MKRITIIGTGFAALTAVRKLRSLDSSVEITIINKKPEFVYLPSLIWVQSGLRKGSDLAVPLHNYLKRMRLVSHAGEVTGLKKGGRVVVTDNGEVENDGLIIASGGRFIKKLPGIEYAIIPCEGISAAEAIRDRLKGMSGGTIAIGFSGNPNEPSAMRGGPMFEFLFGLDTQLRREGRRERFRLVFFNPMKEPGKRLGEKAMKMLLRAMGERGIETHLGHKITGFAQDRVMTEGGDIPADLILFMPGMTGNAWFDNTDLPRSPGGLLKADLYCRVEGRERIYVAGDSGSFPGPDWMPKQAHMANFQAVAAAKNLLAELKGGNPSHTFKVELMCIVDMLDEGMYILRTERRSVALPPMNIMHVAKRLYELWYLQRLR